MEDGNMEFGRLITAMATPFDDTGNVDERALERLIHHLIETKTSAIVVNGTTAESPTLSHDEKVKIISKTVEVVNGRVPVIAGTGGNNTAQTIRFSQ
jgi:4-hydroxy-tetrahydrodipicolinate synthase